MMWVGNLLQTSLINLSKAEAFLVCLSVQLVKCCMWQAKQYLWESTGLSLSRFSSHPTQSPPYSPGWVAQGWLLTILLIPPSRVEWSKAGCGSGQSHTLVSCPGRATATALLPALPSSPLDEARFSSSQQIDVCCSLINNKRELTCAWRVIICEVAFTPVVMKRLRQ